MVSEKLCHSRDSASTAGMLARFGSSISKWLRCSRFGDNARGGLQRDGSAWQSFHRENLPLLSVRYVLHFLFVFFLFSFSFVFFCLIFWLVQCLIFLFNSIFD